MSRPVTSTAGTFISLVKNSEMFNMKSKQMSSPQTRSKLPPYSRCNEAATWIRCHYALIAYLSTVVISPSCAYCTVMVEAVMQSQRFGVVAPVLTNWGERTLSFSKGFARWYNFWLLRFNALGVERSNQIQLDFFAHGKQPRLKGGDWSNQEIESALPDIPDACCNTHRKHRYV